MTDDYKVRNYQDEQDNGEGDIDVVTHEETDDLSDRGIPAEQLKEGFDSVDEGDSPQGTPDDVREEIEDQDENAGRPI